MSDDDPVRHAGGKHDGPARTSPYPMSRLAPAHDLVDVAREIAAADRAIGAVVGGKLEVIARQIRALQEEARALLARAKRDLDLHRAECSFVKRPGSIYHLYRRGEDRLYFSMLSPDDWGGTPPHPYVGSYRLESDSSWTPLDDIEGVPEGPEERLRRLLSGEP
ncbi:MAG TPA: DUF2452 domain-containing protein [Sandaracinaceae bacterium]